MPPGAYTYRLTIAVLAIAAVIFVVMLTVPPAATLVGDTVVVCVKDGVGAAVTIGDGEGLAVTIGVAVGESEGAPVTVGAGVGVAGAGVGEGGAGRTTSNVAALSVQLYCVPQPGENAPRLTR
jgi:hypothetical protein